MLFKLVCTTPLLLLSSTECRVLISAINYTWVGVGDVKVDQVIFFFAKKLKIYIYISKLDIVCTTTCARARNNVTVQWAMRLPATPVFTRCCWSHLSSMWFALPINVCQQLSFSPPAAVSCGVPSAPVNGGVLAADYSVGTRVTYFCNSGYRLSSKELTTTVCQPDGTWSNHNKIPRCGGEKTDKGRGGRM